MASPRQQEQGSEVMRVPALSQKRRTGGTPKHLELSLRAKRGICCCFALRRTWGNSRSLTPKAVRDDNLKITRMDVTYRSEEHTSELQSRQYLVCRLLLEKK